MSTPLKRHKGTLQTKERFIRSEKGKHIFYILPKSLVKFFLPLTGSATFPLSLYAFPKLTARTMLNSGYPVDISV